MKNIKKIQPFRAAVQIIFVLLLLWIGIEFHLFIKYFETEGAAGSSYRPPGVEGFLPISSLMSLYYYFLSGDIHSFHPAGLFIFIAIVGMSLFLGKSFCGWFCPVGTLSEYIGDFGDKIWKKLLGRVPKIPKVIDWILRSIKYLLLGFFVYVIFFSMNEFALKVFLDSDYNLMSDIKMYYFFANITQFSLIVIAVLFVLSIFVKNFWCRYLCPYGALLGFIGLFSPVKIKRNEKSCINCNLCNEACPSRINVANSKRVLSDECISCLQCIDACPVKETLELKTVENITISKKTAAGTIILIFVLITGLAMFTGSWQNKINEEIYKEKFENVHGLGHPTSASEFEELKK